MNKYCTFKKKVLEENSYRHWFKEGKYNFNSVYAIGAIDSSSVRVFSPSKNVELWFNRKCVNILPTNSKLCRVLYEN